MNEAYLADLEARKHEIPEHINWIAQDEDWRVFMYGMPYVKMSVWDCWVSLYDVAKADDWRSSLVRIDRSGPEVTLVQMWENNKEEK